MPLITQRIVRGLTPFVDPYLTPATRVRPEKITLGVKRGHRPSDKPPVRIFLGSERKQFRAERVFIWSVEKHRDPARIYQIYLLKGLKGWISGFWITGFTNYRFAIPHFCDYRGRAIYNDVDQVWLTDPAELFDRDMGKAGFLSINDRDTSVMLIDCKRMAGVWNRDAVRRTTRKRIEARARAAGMWGEMASRYNARDAEYVPGESACVHFTTLHTQPWRPFPDWFVYHRNPTGNLWFDLEREADAIGYLPVSALRPSSGWPDTMLELSARHDGPELQRLLGPRADPDLQRPHRLIANLLERIPDADLPWVLERLFALTDELDFRIHEPRRIAKGRPRRPWHFWIEQFRLAERLHPDTHWRVLRESGGKRFGLSGGPLGDGPVALLNGAPNAPIRADVLAQSLAGSRRELIEIEHPDELSEFDPPPAILVVSGRKQIQAARALARGRPDAPALVLVGQDAGPVPEHRGVVVSLARDGLPPHPHRIELLAGIDAPFSESTDPPPDLPAAWHERPRRGLFVLGPADQAIGPARQRELLEAAAEWSRRRDLKTLVVTTPGARCNTSAMAKRAESHPEFIAVTQAASCAALQGAARGASAALLADGDGAVFRALLGSGRPVWLIPARSDPTLRQRIAGWIAERAFRPQYNKRGSIKPQQGLTYLCARLIERGHVLPPAGISDWQRTLVERGLAAWIGAEAIPAGRWQEESESTVAQILAQIQPAGKTARERSGTRSRHR